MTTKAQSITALILGIVSCVCPWLGWSAILGLICGIIGIVFAVKARKQIEANALQAEVQENNSKGMATAGLVLSIIGVVLSGIMFVCVVCAVCTVASVASTAGGIGSLSSFY